MYRSHFGLAQMPFGSKPEAAFFYGDAGHGELLDTLRYAITQDEGVIKVIGAAGSGKTMLCCMLENVLPVTASVVYLPASDLSAARIIDTIARRLHLALDDKNTDAVLRLLHERLIALHSRGRKVVILVDDAQLMSLEAMEQIRLLTNLEHERSQLLTIALFGQPPLDAMLNLPPMRRFQQRIMHSFDVAPIAPQHIAPLLACRLRAAAYSGPPLFVRAALEQLIHASQGNMRRINLLAGKSLLAALNDQSRVITGKHMLTAIKGGIAKRARRRHKWLLIVGAVLVSVVLVAAAWRANTHKLGEMTANYQLQQLQQLLASSEVWLNSEPGTHLTLQIIILPAAKQAQLNDFLRSMRDEVDVQRVHAYVLRINGIDYIGVSYGNFETQAQAELVQKQLQHSFQAQIRRIDTLREQVRQAN